MSAFVATFFNLNLFAVFIKKNLPPECNKFQLTVVIDILSKSNLKLFCNSEMTNKRHKSNLREAVKTSNSKKSKVGKIRFILNLAECQKMTFIIYNICSIIII